jgi:cytochrome c-type biogenesis protein CcmE
MTRKQRRLILIGSNLSVLAIAVALVLSSLRESIVFFHSPTDIADTKPSPGKRVRLGGRWAVLSAATACRSGSG